MMSVLLHQHPSHLISVIFMTSTSTISSLIAGPQPGIFVDGGGAGLRHTCGQ